MKKKFLKSLIVTLLVLSVVFGTALSAFALPVNDVTKSYFYNVDSKDASAPRAFTVERVISVSDLITGSDTSTAFTPEDLCYANGYLYVLDSAGNSVFVLDDQYQVVARVKTLVGDVPNLAIVEEKEEGEEEEEGGGNKTAISSNKFAFNAPRGLFVTADGTIYVSDTENQRIVACDITGKVLKVYQSIKCTVLGKSYAFRPCRLVVDNTGDIQVICEGINRGIMQITSDGEFRAFFGSPDVVISLWERVWRNLATDEQRAKMVTYTPTEYSSLTIDERGFVYPTVAALEEASVSALHAKNKTTTYAPVKKLSADGTDMLRRKGTYSPMGDINWPNRMTGPKIVDISVDSASGRYTLLDQRTGRFFTYDADGNMLYLCGGSALATGAFELASAIEAKGDYVYVADSIGDTVTVFRATEYVHALNAAAQASANGLWEESIPRWQEVLSYNSNMYIANIGLGKAEMRIAMNLIDDQTDANGLNALDHYAKAIEYFDRANEKTNYSVAYTALRTHELEQYFGWIFGGIGVIVVGFVVLGIVRKQKKKKKDKPVFRPSDREAPVVNRAKKKGDEE